MRGVDLPNGWIQATIDELCDLNPKHNQELSDKTLVSFVPMAAVSDVLGTIIEPQDRTLGEVRKGYTHFADGDVIFAKIAPCMENGKAASVRGMTNGLACGTTEFYVFRSHGVINQDFLFHFIRQESYRKAAGAAMQSGVGQTRVPKEFVLNTELPVPPLTEQRRVVAKIEALQERSRRAREALTEVGPLLEQFRQSVLAAAFRGNLTADWRAAHPNVEPASKLLHRILTERRAVGNKPNWPNTRPKVKSPRRTGKTGTKNQSWYTILVCRNYRKDGFGPP
jgi:type I restriction enzyme S subunit